MRLIEVYMKYVCWKERLFSVTGSIQALIMVRPRTLHFRNSAAFFQWLVLFRLWWWFGQAPSTSITQSELCPCIGFLSLAPIVFTKNVAPLLYIHVTHLGRTTPSPFKLVDIPSKTVVHHNNSIPHDDHSQRLWPHLYSGRQWCGTVTAEWDSFPNHFTKVRMWHKWTWYFTLVQGIQAVNFMKFWQL